MDEQNRTGSWKRFAMLGAFVLVGFGLSAPAAAQSSGGAIGGESQELDVLGGGDDDTRPGPKIETDEPAGEDEASQETMVPLPTDEPREQSPDSSDGGLGKDYLAPAPPMLSPAPGNPGVFPDEDSPYDQ